MKRSIARIESALRESEHRLRKLRERRRAALWLYDPNTEPGIVAIAEEGADDEEADAPLGRPERILAAMAPGDRMRCERVLRGETSSGPMPDVWIPDRGEAPRWIRLRGFRLPDGGSGVRQATVVEDVTRAHALDEHVGALHVQLRSMVLEVVFAQELERSRLAQDLHDTVQQTLAVAAMRVDALTRKDAAGRFSEEIEDLRRLLAEAARCVTSTTFDLSPPVLRDLGLVAALQWLAEDVSRRHGLPVAFEPPQSVVTLEPRAEILLYRAVRELLLNVVRHARASWARVEVETSDTDVRLRVTDDGCGFDPAVLDEHPEESFGLFSMRERLNHIGAELDIDSGEGHGTVVEIRVDHRAGAPVAGTAP